MLISPFSAIPSWEGFEYQGHIALYVVLQKLYEFVSRNDNSIKNYILEIEGAEDFSIKDGTQYITLHQVKSGTIDLDQDGQKDKFSFIISLLQYNADHGYYHTTPDKTIPDDFVFNTFNWINTLISDLDKEIKNANEIIPDDSEKYIVLNKIGQNTKKGSLYNIINFVCNGRKEKEDVRTVVKEIKTELTQYRDKLIVDEKLIDDKLLITKYFKSFNDIMDIKEASYIVIKDIINLKNPGWHMIVDNAYIEFVYGQIFLEIKNKITKDYIDSKKVCQLRFETILHLILEDYHTKANSIKYQYFLIWRRIQNIYKQYPIKNKNICIVDSCENCKNPSDCNLYKQIQAILNINEDDLHNLLYKLMLKEPVEGTPNNLPDDNLINRLFINLLKEISLLSYEKNNLVQAQKNNKFYRLTLNSSGEPYELQELLENEIRNLKGDELLIFENDILITDQLNADYFTYDGLRTTVIGDNEYKDLRGITSDSIEKTIKNCNKPKVMRLIDRNNAKKELNQ